MPVYECIIPEGSVAMELRPKIATAFTDIHCDTTGAPRSFVHVIFWDVPDGTDSGYPDEYYIDGHNRAGRTYEVKETIRQSLVDAFCKISGINHAKVGSRIIEAPGGWTMEAGHILPNPGEEGPEYYLKEHAAD